MTKVRIDYRIAVVNSHPIQYFAPLYAYLSRNQEIKITALYCTDFSLRGGVDQGFKQKVTWNVDLLAGYRAVFLGERAKRRTPGGFFSLICPEVWQEIRDGGYDAVWLHGYAYAAYVLSFFAAKSCGLPVLIRSETHLGLARPGWRRWLRDEILRIAYRFVDGCLAIGTANRAYYRALGVPNEKIFDVPYTVDNDRFIAAATMGSVERAAVRAKYGLSIDMPVVLYASKFMRRKHPDDLIRVMSTLNDKGLKATLLMVGTGEMEEELRNLAISLSLDNVIFAGFINQAELPKIYAASDVFVLPSENEPWGLIVNEVMCAGLPVVVSDEVGCVPDLVKYGVNGFHIKTGDISSLANALDKLLADVPLRHRMGAASLSIIRDWSFEQCRRGIEEALRQCVRAA
jgi:glycosyltransferase involved in cell wall biosynthesis